MLHRKYEFEGRFKLTVRKSDSLNVVSETDFFDNIITNSGLNQLAAEVSNLFVGCTVGNGTTPEAATDVSIESYVARTQNVQTPINLTSGSSVSPYYGKATITWRFPAGSATGNLTEVGVVHTWGGGFPLWSRTLIKDSTGNPVTLTILSDEVLDVTYEARVYYQEVAVTGIAEILGNSYSYKVLSSRMTNIEAANCFVYGLLPRTAPNARCVLFDGVLSAAPLNAPTGAQIGYSEGHSARPAYVAGTYSITPTYTFGPGNGTGAIRSIRFSGYNGRAPEFGIELTPAFVKTPEQEFKVSITLSWGRRAI